MRLRAHFCRRIPKVTSKNKKSFLAAGPGVGRTHTRALVPFARANGTNGPKVEARSLCARMLFENRIRMKERQLGAMATLAWPCPICQAKHMLTRA